MGKGISTGSGSPSRNKFAPVAAAASLFVCLGVPLAHAVGTEAEILQQTSDTFSSSASTSLTLAVPFMSLIPTINEYFPVALLLTATFFTSSRSDAKLSSFIDKQTATNAEISRDILSLKNVVNEKQELTSRDIVSLKNVVNKNQELASKDIVSLKNVVNKNQELASKDIASLQVSIKSLSKEVKAIGNKVGFLYEENFRDRSAESHRRNMRSYSCTNLYDLLDLILPEGKQITNGEMTLVDGEKSDRRRKYDLYADKLVVGALSQLPRLESWINTEDAEISLQKSLKEASTHSQNKVALTKTISEREKKVSIVRRGLAELKNETSDGGRKRFIAEKPLGFHLFSCFVANSHKGFLRELEFDVKPKVAISAIGVSIQTGEMKSGSDRSTAIGQLIIRFAVLKVATEVILGIFPFDGYICDVPPRNMSVSLKGDVYTSSTSWQSPTETELKSTSNKFGIIYPFPGATTRVIQVRFPSSGNE
jgi:hypothetical protein